MSIRCTDCGAAASYGSDIGHKSNCPSLREQPRHGLKPYPLTLCPHEDFKATVNVGRLTASDNDPTITGYTADVRIECTGCGAPFQFLGLRPGVDSHMPTVSVDGLEARLPLSPFDRKITPPKRIRLTIDEQN